MQEPELQSVPNGLAGYEAIVARTYFPMRFSRVAGSQRFQSRSAGVRIGPALLTRLYADGAYRGCVETGRCARDAPYVLNLAESGGCEFHGVREARTQPGDFILLDASRPFEVMQPTAGQSLALLIPAPILASHCARPSDLALRPVPSTTGVPALLRDLLLGCWRQRHNLAPAAASELLGATAQMIGAAFRGARPLPESGTRASQLHFLRIRDVVVQHLVSPDLGPAFVAARLGMSKSHVFSVMHAAGTTLGRFILETRLERARQLLRHPSDVQSSIASIGYAVGFQEAAHFSRRFSDRYGESPRAYRDRQRPEACPRPVVTD